MVDGARVDGARRSEILDTAAELFASSGSRTSLKDIAAASGILPGSLYHHFESKDAILLELVQRYQDELRSIADAAVAAIDAPDVPPFDLQVVMFGSSIASCAVRHRAALLLTLYEPPSGASAELSSMVETTTGEVQQAMLTLLATGRAAGALRADVDLGQLAERLCQSLLHHGVGDSYLLPEAARIPALRCRLVLEGLAAAPVDTDRLDRSDALAAVRELARSWPDEPERDDPRVTRIVDAARDEFGRRGYDETTIRDIAAAAGMSIAAIYRCFRSKDEILAAVLEPYAERRAAMWAAAVASSSSPLEQLDALAWAFIALLERHRAEYRVQLAWLRDSPPSFHALGSTAEQRRTISALLAEGARTGELHFERGNANTRTRCVFEALWTPEHIVVSAGVDAAHRLARQTVLGGALVRS
jgi:AcrR family transcriptional regulator